MRSLRSQKMNTPKPTVQMPPVQAILRFEDVTLKRGRRTILEGVDLAVNRGEIVTVIGPNGAGKTSLVLLALGILPPSRGRIFRDPKAVIGYVPQRFTPDPSLPLSLRGLMRLTAMVDRATIDRALAEVGLADQAEDAVASLSWGQLQRGLLARAILRKPDLLVLDEPTQGVDFASERRLYELVKRLQKEIGSTILLVSHDLHFVMAATDRVICLEQKICCQGPPKDVQGDASYRRLFGENAQRAVAIYEHHHHGHRREAAQDIHASTTET